MRKVQKHETTINKKVKLDMNMTKVRLVCLSLLLALSFLAVFNVVQIPAVKGDLTPNPSFDYTMAKNATATYIIAKNGTFMYSNVQPVTAFATMIGYVASGGTCYVNSETYSGNAHFWMQNCHNITLTFEEGAVFTLDNGVNQGVLLLQNADNCTLNNVSVDGNSAYQSTASSGVVIYIGSNNIIDGATITDCRRDGFAIYDEGIANPCSNDGIINSLITFCGWNGITLSSTYGYYTNQYATNNEIAYCGDVGISTYAMGCTIADNYIHDMNGTTGDNGAQWGIGLEGYTESEPPLDVLVLNNTIVNCLAGVNLGICRALIKENNITDCDNGPLHKITFAPSIN